MKDDNTDEFSFILKPAKYGVGVFATHDIVKGTHLRLFGDEKLYEQRIRMMKKEDVPVIFQDYCMSRGEYLVCPEDFGQMTVGWYLNHSNKSNAEHRDFNWYASRDIKIGEEILINYNTLEEPEEDKDNFY